MAGTTAAILDQVRSLGYVVKEFNVNGTVEFMRAFAGRGGGGGAPQ